MAPARTLKRSYSAAQLGLQAGNATTGVWATQLSSSLYSLHKAAAGTTSVVNIAVPPGPRGGLPTNEDAQVSIIEVFYKVTTAVLTSAPTVVLSLNTQPGGTGSGTVSRSAVTQVLSFAGADSVGTAVADHIAVVTVSTPFTMLDSDHLILTITMNEGATSVLDLFGITVTYV